ncbi:MAG: hypothetical protein MUC31_06400 [Bacteroidales bacterium]|jgi:hypothetical protein|nr:hypothetical protein [Bacteroidales bacterium]
MRPFIFAIIFFCAGKIVAQDTFLETDLAYGLDPLLYNGKKYSYFLPRGTGGHQFFISEEFVTGEVTIKGINFKGIAINYDIYNQRLLLQYADETGSQSILEVSEAWLESFRMDTVQFLFLENDQGSRIYQVLGNSPCCILYYWWKTLKLDNSASPAHYKFTPPVKSMFVLIDGKLHSFSSTGSLVSAFDPAKKPEIKNYLKANGIKLKKASDKTMTDLINFISNLH